MQPLARAVSGDAETALAAGVLAIACPLALVTVSRPLSDAPGLAAALGVQALLAAAFAQQRGWRARDVAPAELAATGRLIVLAAFAAGLAIGLRTQTAWLTLPLLILVIADRAGRSAAAAIVGSAVTFTAGVLCWALPLVIASGGPAAYWRAIASQAGEDLEGVDMLFTSTRPLWRLAMNLLQTFVLPWGPLPLAVVVLTLAAIGIVVLLRRDRRGLVLLAGAAAPYAIFHLVWQENVTTRYALPIVPPIALLAAIGLRGLGWRGLASGTLGPGALGRWTARVGATAIAGFALAAGLPALTAYTREPAPVFRLFADMRSAGRPEDVVVAMHRRGHADTRRARGLGRAVGLSVAAAGRADRARVARAGALLARGRRRAYLAARRPAPHRPGAHRSGQPARQRALRLVHAVRRRRRRRHQAGRARLGGDRRTAGVVPRPGMGAVAGDRRRVERRRQGPVARRRGGLDAAECGAAGVWSSAAATSVGPGRRSSASRCGSAIASWTRGTWRRTLGSSCAASRSPALP